MKNVYLLGIRDGFLSNKANIEDFLNRYSQSLREENNTTTMILCDWFKSPSAHSSDITTLGFETDEFKKFLNEHDLQSSFQGISYPVFEMDEQIEDTYLQHKKTLAEFSAKCYQLNQIPTLSAAWDSILKGAFCPRVNWTKDALNFKQTAKMFIAMRKKKHAHFIKKIEFAEAGYEKAFVLLSPVEAVQMKMHNTKWNIDILPTDAPGETADELLLKEVMAEIIIPSKLAKKYT
jgi:hypothetical protein